MTTAKMTMWEVSGTFLLSGSKDKKDKLSFGPVRVLGSTRTEASAGLVETLNEAFHKELRSVPRVAFQHVGFSRGFALMHLQWREVVCKPDVKTVAIEAMVSAVTDDRNDPPAIETAITG